MFASPSIWTRDAVPDRTVPENQCGPPAGETAVGVGEKLDVAGSRVVDPSLVVEVVGSCRVLQSQNM